MIRLLLSVLFFVLLADCSPEQGQSAETNFPTATSRSPGDFADLLDAGVLSIIRANGNGSSSGASIHGAIRNQSPNSIAVDIVMTRPILFRNSGIGQNMIGSMLFEAGGGFNTYGSNSFVSLEPSEQTGITFVAYCVDFEKDNPTANESFTVGYAPPDLVHVMNRIAAYARDNLEADITVPAQVAVWLAQGVDAESIRSKFPFGATEEILAKSFVQ